MDCYQAIYDAARSRISNGDIGSAIESAIRDCNISHSVEMAMLSIQYASAEHSRPSVIFCPKLSLDGDQWCALYGDNLQDGIAGFGDSPEEAMRAFDANFNKKLKEPK